MTECSRCGKYMPIMRSGLLSRTPVGLKLRPTQITNLQGIEAHRMHDLWLCKSCHDEFIVFLAEIKHGKKKNASPIHG